MLMGRHRRDRLVSADWRRSLKHIRQLDVPWPGDYEVIVREDNRRYLSVAGVKQYEGEHWDIIRPRKHQLMVVAEFRTSPPVRILVQPYDVGTLTISVPPEYETTIEVVTHQSPHWKYLNGSSDDE